MIDNVPKGTGQETPKTKKVRRCIKKYTELSDDDERWDSLGSGQFSNPHSLAVNVECGGSGQSTPFQTPHSSRSEPVDCDGSTPRARLLGSMEIVSNPPLPAANVECGGSGQSTPFQTPHSSRNELMDCGGSTPRAPRLQTMPQKRDDTSKRPTKRPLNFLPADDGTTSATAVTGQRGLPALDSAINVPADDGATSSTAVTGQRGLPAHDSAINVPADDGATSSTAVTEQRGLPAHDSAINVPADDGATSSTAVTEQRGLPAHDSAINTRSRTRVPPRGRILNDDDISSALCFLGSESESSDDDDDAEGEASMPVRIPRAVQIYFDDIGEATTSRAVVDMQWPPSARLTVPERPSTPPRPSPTSPLLVPSSLRPATPAPAATLTDSEVLHSPIDKFDFNWQSFPAPPVPPELRREPFFNFKSGPTASYDTPYDAFTAIWDLEIMEKIAKETNDYAQVLAQIMIKEHTMCPTSRINDWQDTNPDELYRFFGVILAMGAVYKSRIEEYWNTSLDIFITPQFTTAIPIDRFLLLSRCLHFSPVRTRGQESMTNAKAKLYKVQLIIDHLNLKFSTLYNLGQNIALDESLTMWKGWLDINQFINNKAASIGIKTYEVCESHTGYLWRFELHAGHEPPVTEGPLSGTIPTLVLRLLNGLEHRGHTVWMDNFYNSPALAREMKSLGFDCVGTLRTDRQLVPTELAKLNKQQMVLGQVVGCTSGDVDLVVWRDKNRVALISTYHGLATTKCGETIKPTIVHDYNICMGGVDKKDQMLAMYPIERKRTRIWYKKFFRRLLNASVLNAYTLHKADHKIKHRAFRKTLIKQIMEKHPNHKAVAVPPPREPQLMHFPKQYDELPPSAPGAKTQRHRARCRVCKKRVYTYCQVCNEALCVFECFSKFVHKQ